ncbi:hypothetical protein KO361_03945 [Candidatus Woesearchaeota archaeon]|nr:hypothetical protein [Candidatus Woesearchaeota archaeon]
MSLNKKLTKIDLYALAKIDSLNPTLEYMIVGGLNVQIHAYEQFKNYLRTTIDADILVKNISFKDFLQGYGKEISVFLKNKFDLHYHVQRNHNANTITTTTNKVESSKDVFLLSFTRYQDELYKKIKEDIEHELKNNFYNIPLKKLDITPETIMTKAKIEDTNNLYLKVRKPELELKRKLKRIEKKAEFKQELRPDYEDLRKKILNNSYLNLENISSFHEQVLIDSVIKPERHDIEKDLYDYFLLKKIIS